MQTLYIYIYSCSCQFELNVIIYSNRFDGKKKNAFRLRKYVIRHRAEVSIIYYFIVLKWKKKKSHVFSFFRRCVRTLTRVFDLVASYLLLLLWCIIHTQAIHCDNTAFVKQTKHISLVEWRPKSSLACAPAHIIQYIRIVTRKYRKTSSIPQVLPHV